MRLVNLDKASGDGQEHPPPNRAVGAFVHPVTLICLAGWLLNDHLLKSIHGGLVTGKLSDVFGLIVFPLVVATALPQRWPRIGTGVAVTAALFTSINVSGRASEMLTDGLSVVLPGARLTPDPTDLFVLPVLAVSPWIWRNRVPVSNRQQRALARIVFGVAVLATTATSYSEGNRYSAPAIVRVEVDPDTGNFLALHHNLLFERWDETEQDADPVPPEEANPPEGLPPREEWDQLVVYRSEDGSTWETTTIDAAEIDWSVTTHGCIRDACIMIESDPNWSAADGGTVQDSAGETTFRLVEPPPDCHENGSPFLPSPPECRALSAPGPLDLAVREDADPLIVVALGTQGVAVFDGEDWDQVSVATPGPRPWRHRNVPLIIRIVAVAFVLACAAFFWLVYLARERSPTDG